MSRSKKYIIGALACSMLFSAHCLGVRTGRDTDKTLVKLNQTATKPSVDFKVQSRAELAAPTGAGDFKFKNIGERVMSTSGHFERVAEGINKEANHIDITVEYMSHNTALAGISGFFCGLTLGVLPGYMGTSEYKTTFDVSRNGKFVKSYKYEDIKLSQWGWLLNLFALPFTSAGKKEDALIEGIYIQFLNDMAKDKIL